MRGAPPGASPQQNSPQQGSPQQGSPRASSPRQGAPGERPSSSDAGAVPSVVSVAQLTDRINAALKGFGRVSVEGEVSRPKTVASGHMFFTLKDERAALDAKIWKAQVPRALGGLRLEDGAKVVCHGTLDVYAPYGKHSLIVDRVEARGLGAMLAELERLKGALREEGLFDRKRPLPRRPRMIGVVTSRDADAWRDFLRTRALRWPDYPVRLCHSRVQGKMAAREIAGAIGALDRSGVDVIVVCRGGGAIEDLWCFNEEIVARAAFGASVPVVSGVGHETDTTLIDFVSDHRAHTPTDAAQTVIPDLGVLYEALDRAGAYLDDSMGRALTARVDRFERAAARRVLSHPLALVEPRASRLEHVARGLESSVESQLQRSSAALERLALRLEQQSPVARLGRVEERLGGAALRITAAMARMGERVEERVQRSGERLDAGVHDALQRAERRLEPAARTLGAVSPLAVLDRGYSITRRADGSVVTVASELAKGEALTTITRSGEIDSTVEGTRPVGSIEPTGGVEP